MKGPLEIGHSYFISDSFFGRIDCEANNILYNHGPFGMRAYMCAMEKDGFYYMVPISHKVEKFRRMEEKCLSKYGRCDIVVFGTWRGKEHAWSLANSIPMTAEFVESEFTSEGLPLFAEYATQNEIITKMSKIHYMALYKGKNLAKANWNEIIEFLMTHTNTHYTAVVGDVCAKYQDGLITISDGSNVKHSFFDTDNEIKDDASLKTYLENWVARQRGRA